MVRGWPNGHGKLVDQIFYESPARARKERSRSERDAASIGHPDFGFWIADFGIIFFYNPHSAIGNPHFGYVRPSQEEIRALGLQAR